MDANLTSNSAWGNSTANNLAPVFGLLIGLGGIFVLLSLVFLVYHDARWVRRLLSLFPWLQRIVRRFAIGTGALTPFAALAGLGWYVSHMDAEKTGRGLLWIGAGLAIFAVIATLGYFTEKWWTRVKAHATPTRDDLPV